MAVRAVAITAGCRRRWDAGHAHPIRPWSRSGLVAHLRHTAPLCPV